MLRWLKTYLTKRRLLRKAISPDATLRQGAASELGKHREEWAARQLVGLLSDAHTPVRESARAGLAEQGLRALPTLLEGLKSSRPEVAETCADLLGDLRVASAVEPLLIALKFGQRPVQLAAKGALERCGSLAVPALEAALPESQPWVHKQIELALQAARRASSASEPNGSAGASPSPADSVG